MNQATHIGTDNRYYRKTGEWWFVWRNDAWWNIIGKPSVTLSRLQ